MPKQHIGSHNAHAHPDGYMPPRATVDLNSTQRSILKKISRKKDRQRGKKTAENGET